jgi:hypothetical protein
VNGERGLADAALLVEETDDHEYLPEMRLCGIAILRVAPFAGMVKHGFAALRGIVTAEVRKGDFVPALTHAP